MTAPVPYSYRDDPAVPAFPDDRPVLIFDGHCAMCSALARFVMGADREGRVRLLACQSPLGQALYRHYGLDGRDFDTKLLLDGGVARRKSDGAIRLLEILGPPWSLARVGRILPGAWRDWAYDLVARNRLRWFGRRAVCYRPEPAYADRLLQ